MSTFVCFPQNCIQWNRCVLSKSFIGIATSPLLQICRTTYFLACVLSAIIPLNLDLGLPCFVRIASRECF